MSSSSSKNNFVHKFYTDIMPMVYGFGAAIVIIGAMFKLLNLSGASVMLAAGLTTEALLFILGIFEPKHKEFDWYKVYPQFKEDEGDESPSLSSANLNVASGKLSVGKKNVSDDSISISSKLDDIFSKAKIDGELIDRLGKGMEKIAGYADNMSAFAEVSTVSDKYCKSISNASGMLDQMTFAHDKISGALNALSSIADSGKGYSTKMNDIIGSLDEIGSAYKKELAGVEHRLNLMNSTYDSIKNTSSGFELIGNETTKFKEELGNLNKKFESLNSIYGNMLNAFKG